MHTPAVRSGLLALGLLVPSVGAQTVLQPDDIAVVTSEGAWVVHQQTSVKVYTPPAPLDQPAIAWLPGTDTLFVTAGATLTRIDVQSLAPLAISTQVLDPDFPPPFSADLRDVDVDPATGDLWLLDNLNQRAYRFVAPFTHLMTPDLSIELGVEAYDFGIDTTNSPLSVVYSTDGDVRRTDVNGNTSTVVLITMGRTSGVAVDPAARNSPAVLTHRPSDGVWATSTSINLLANMNITGGFGGSKIVTRPHAVAYDPFSVHAYVLAEAVNPTLFPGHTSYPGMLHVVRMPLGTGAIAGLGLSLVTDATGFSAITGLSGHLTIVRRAYPFSAPYGPTCKALTGEIPLLTASGTQAPALGNLDFALEVSAGPAQRPVYFAYSFLKASNPIQGCSELVFAATWRPRGMTDNQGRGSVPIAIPPLGALAGFDVFTQCVVFDVHLKPTFTPGLHLHLE